MKKAAVKDEKATPPKNPRVTRQAKTTTARTRKPRTTSTNGKTNSTTSIAKETKAGPGRPRGTTKAPARKQSKTSKKASTRSEKATSNDNTEDLILNELNTMDMDHYTEDVLDNPLQGAPSEKHQQERDKFIDELMQEILPEDRSESREILPSSAKSQGEALDEEKISGTTSESRPAARSRSVNSLGVSLIGKTWGIKAMVGVTIVIVFLLFNHFVFIEKKTQTAFDYLSNSLSEVERAIHTGSPVSVKAKLVGKEDLSLQQQINVDQVTVGMDVPRLTNKFLQSEEELMSDQEISQQELNFWQTLAKTSFEEISEIQKNLVLIQDNHPNGDNVGSGEETALVLSSEPPMNGVDISSSETISGEYLLYDGGSSSEPVPLNTIREGRIHNKSPYLIADRDSRTPLIAKVGMEEPIAIPVIHEDMHNSLLGLETDRQNQQSLQVGLEDNEGSGLATILQNISLQIETLNAATQGILDILKTSNVLLDTLVQVSDQNPSEGQSHWALSPDLAANIKEKFRISGFPGVETAYHDQPGEITTTKQEDITTSIAETLSEEIFLENIDPDRLKDLEAVPLIPLQSSPSSELMVIRSLSEMENGYDSMKGVVIGDNIPGFGLVLNIKEDRAGRLIIMENGIVYLN